MVCYFYQAYFGLESTLFLPNKASYSQRFSYVFEGNKSFPLIFGMHKKDMSKMLEGLGNVIFILSFLYCLH